MKPKRKRYKVVNTITTVNGTLYSKDYRVKDTMGRIWFVNKENLK